MAYNIIIFKYNNMKINFDLKNKYPSVEFCYNNKAVIIRYWGGLKIDKVVIYGMDA